MKTTTQKGDKFDLLGNKIFTESQADIDERFGVNRHKNRPEDPRRRRVKHVPEGKSLTKQEFMAECDINNIVARHTENGTFQELLMEGTAIASRSGEMVDLTTAPDFEKAQNILANANQAFKELPAKIRERFGSPQKFLEFIHMKDSEDKIQEGLRLGLWTKEEAPKPSVEEQTLETLKGIKDSLNAPLTGAKDGKKGDR